MKYSRYTKKQKKVIREHFNSGKKVYQLAMDYLGWYVIEIEHEVILEECFKRNNILKKKKNISGYREIKVKKETK